jgi:hypothetical protein
MGFTGLERKPVGGSSWGGWLLTGMIFFDEPC